MNIVIAIDSFKGCISSVDSGRLLKQAIEEVYPGDVVSVFPLADGGEGTVDAMTQGLNGRIVKAPVTGPLGTKVESRYGLLPDTKTAVIEMADASGLPLVPPEKRNPLHTTTYGLGELILAAIDAGCRHFIIGIGGSATNDFRFLKADGSRAGVAGGDLADVAQIDARQADSRLQDCTFEIACDVTNPLCGPEGCSNVFGPQKGATEAIVARMDDDIHHFARAHPLGHRHQGGTLQGRPARHRRGTHGQADGYGQGPGRCRPAGKILPTPLPHRGPLWLCRPRCRAHQPAWD